MTVTAAVMPGPNEPIELREFADPVLEDGSILLQTIASEVCGTDVHLQQGRLDGVPYPIIPGHVSVGRILEMRNLTQDALGNELAIGDTVTFYDVHEICNSCYYCTIARQPNRCPSRRVYGITYSASDGLLGGLSQQIYLKPGVRVLKLPDEIDSDDLIGGGCGLFTGFAAVERSDLQMGDVVIVQGSGPVGLCAAAFASMRGAAIVIVIGAPKTRLDLALTLGADIVLSIEDKTTQCRLEKVNDITNGRGADVIIEASGNPNALPEGFSLLRDGGIYVIAGHFTDAGSCTINPHIDINCKHADVRGQWGTDFHHVASALRMLGKHNKQFPFRDIIGSRYKLKDAQKALDDVAALRVTKAIIDPN
ncbi:MAG: zinc-binding dehydrogenase [Planctomycetes bacterium]|nr:zinc-binding dehydrogenase [Planctomycetota bacterium]